MDYREAGRVSVFQEGLKNDGKVVPEETVGEQQLLKSFLWMKVTHTKKIYLSAFSLVNNNSNHVNYLHACNSLYDIVFDQRVSLDLAG